MNTLDTTHDHHELPFIKKYVFSTDHKMIGIQFLFTTLLMMLLGGALALGVRWQLAWPWQSMPIFGGHFASGRPMPVLHPTASSAAW